MACKTCKKTVCTGDQCKGPFRRKTMFAAGQAKQSVEPAPKGARASDASDLLVLLGLNERQWQTLPPGAGAQRLLALFHDPADASKAAGYIDAYCMIYA